jgi:hypothetical protein
MDVTKNMHEGDREPKRVLSYKELSLAISCREAENCHIPSERSREVMAIMVIEGNRRQKLEEIKKIQRRNGRERCAEG